MLLTFGVQNMKKLFISVILVFLAIMVVYGYISKVESANNSIPESFRYEGKPINAFCINNILMGDSSRFDPIKISECMNNTKKYDTWKDESYEAFKNFEGFHYKSKEDESDHGYIYYKYLGNTDGMNIIFSQSNGGGTGHFSSITLIKFDPNQGTIQNVGELAGGDRCNGGIDPNSVIFKDNKITYSQHITPHMFLDKIASNLLMTLPDCAICCIATAQIETDLNNLQHRVLKSITLNNDIGPMLSEADNKDEECFNKSIQGYVQKGIRIISPTELKNLSGSLKECSK